MSIRGLMGGMGAVPALDTKSARGEAPATTAFTSVLAHELTPAPARREMPDADDGRLRARGGDEAPRRVEGAPKDAADEAPSAAAEDAASDDAGEASSESEEATSPEAADADEKVVAMDQVPTQGALVVAALPEAPMGLPLGESAEVAAPMDPVAPTTAAPTEVAPTEVAPMAMKPSLEGRASVGDLGHHAPRAAGDDAAAPELAAGAEAGVDELVPDDAERGPSSAEPIATANPQLASQDVLQAVTASSAQGPRVNANRNGARTDRALQDAPSSAAVSRVGANHEVGVQLAQAQLTGSEPQVAPSEDAPSPARSEFVDVSPEHAATEESHAAGATPVEETSERPADVASGAAAPNPDHVEPHPEVVVAHDRLDGRASARESRGLPAASTPAHFDGASEGIDDRRHQAAASAVNHMTLRHGAAVEVELPELGRIHIDARTVAGEVDVDMRSVDTSTVAVLQSVSASLESELRNSSVELRNLEIRGHAGGSSARQSTSSGDDRSHGDGSRGRQGSSSSGATGSPMPAPRGRVRIVL